MAIPTLTQKRSPVVCERPTPQDGGQCRGGRQLRRGRRRPRPRPDRLGDVRDAGRAFTDAELQDLRALFHLAWIDPEVPARAPFVADIAGKPYAFLSYVGWAGTFRPRQAAEGDKGGAALGGSTVFAEDLAALPDAATAVLQYHSGLEYSDDPGVSCQ